jgi:broad-specificity NMP kinase
MKPSITIVSGLPRSGTSMMMKVLESGGIQVLTDNIRQADEDNLTGYYEFERVKQIKEDKEWLKDAEGKAVKLISALLKHLPNTYQYRILFMHREISEILASQKQMLERRGENTDSVPDKTMAVLFQNHLIEVKAWLASQNNIKTLNVSYNEILKHPVSNIERINKFLGGNLNKEKMIEVVDPTLYRQRKAG